MAGIRDHIRFDSVWWRKFAYLGSAHAPEWFKRAAPPAIGATIFALASGRREAAIENMMRVLGTNDRVVARRVALQMFQCFAQCLSETLESYGLGTEGVRCDTPAVNPVAEALEAGRGAILVTAHLGNWDLAAHAIQHRGHAINVVMGREPNETAQGYGQQAREAVGVRVIYSDTSVFASLNMIRALQRNEIVALQLDRLQGPRMVAQEVPFFGRPTPFPVGPFALARLSGAPLIPVFVPRRGRRHYELKVGQPYYVRRGGDRQTLRHVMVEVVAYLELIIREHPDQWFQFAPFWPSVDSPRIANCGTPPDGRGAELNQPGQSEHAAKVR